MRDVMAHTYINQSCHTCQWVMSCVCMSVRVMSHIWMSVLNTWMSISVMSHVSMSHIMHVNVCMGHVTHMNECIRCINGWICHVMPHMWMSHVMYMNVCMGHVTHMNECIEYVNECICHVMPHMWMSHVMYMNVCMGHVTHMNECIEHVNECICHVTRINGSRYAYECVYGSCHTWMSVLDILMGSSVMSCHTCEWVTVHLSFHVTHTEWVMISLISRCCHSPT